MTTSLASPIVTSARGTELLLHVMHLIDVEAATHPNPDEMNEIGRWDQGTWGRFDMRALHDAGQPVDVVSGSEIDGAIAYTACGTALCFAGHTVLAAGDRIRLGSDVNMFSGQVWMWDVRACDGPRAGQVVDVESRAAELLGIDSGQASVLFAGNNSLVEVRQTVADLVMGIDCRNPSGE